MVALTGIERACRQCWLVPGGASLVVSVLAVTRDGRNGCYGVATWSPGGHPARPQGHKESAPVPPRPSPHSETFPISFPAPPVTGKISERFRYGGDCMGSIVLDTVGLGAVLVIAELLMVRHWFVAVRCVIASPLRALR